MKRVVILKIIKNITFNNLINCPVNNCNNFNWSRGVK